ncbi:uncharacterized protein LOC143196336 [Rhynchophorus ferrugineus]|uniref:uncharacterized protein LOC143196336 n=1 Tax=Rhynchophorus ferrugineus TaxID=354439 RepID=UPI003FCE38D1
MPRDEHPIYELQYLLDQRITVKSQRATGQPEQSFNRQLYERYSRNFRSPPKCIKCTGNHESRSCKKDRKTPAKKSWAETPTKPCTSFPDLRLKKEKTSQTTSPASNDKERVLFHSYINHETTVLTENPLVLQPSSSPYNITEKVQQANLDLFNSTLETARSIKVKFREELVSFEPDLTDDDVNSIESDQVEEDQGIIEKVPDSTDNMSAYSTVLRENISLEDTEEEEEEVGEAFVEEILSSDDDGEIQAEGSFRQSEYVAESKVSNELRKGNVEDQIDQKAEKRKNKGRKGSKRTEINCKDHCIEQVDSRLSMLIKKLDIQEKPVVNLPPLQLHQRHCCDDTKSSHSFRNLPNYNGYRSEYGLSYRQLKNKHKHIETIRQKEMARQKLIEEYRIMKVQQNESVFCQWLKEVSRRNRQKREINRENKLRLKSVGFQPQTPQKCLSPNVVNINQSLMRQERDRVRPKTAGFNEFVPKGHIKKKRPSTTQSCVYIELPKSVLKKGIYIGDLLITNSKKISKKLHILTVTH